MSIPHAGLSGEGGGGGEDTHTVKPSKRRGRCDHKFLYVIIPHAGLSGEGGGGNEDTHTVKPSKRRGRCVHKCPFPLCDHSISRPRW